MVGAFPERVEVMGIPIDPLTMEQTVERACQLAQEGSFAHLVGVNADKYLQMRDDPYIDEVVRSCEVINADGSSIVMAARSLGVEIPERVTGIDLMAELCKRVEGEGIGIYLLGAKPEVVENTALALFDRFPELSIVGFRDGYFAEDDYDAVGHAIEESGASIVFVGITSPKKEQLIEHFRAQGLRGVFIGVGGSFDVVSGLIPRAPQWMQETHLEWLFRMAKEPRRLFKRYLVGNARFMLLLTKERVAQRKGLK